jgi:hypothetical protein
MTVLLPSCKRILLAFAFILAAANGFSQTYTLSDDDVIVENGIILSCDYNFVFKDIIIPETLDNQTVTGIGKEAFAYKMFNSVVISNSVISIGDNAFAMSTLTNVTLPSSLKTIGNGAFSENSIESIVLPNSIVSIGNNAFSMNRLIELNLPDGLIRIESGAFQSNLLTDINIPNSITYIGNSAFNYNSIESLIIPNSVEYIGSNAFSQNLISNITLPNSIEIIEHSTFSNNSLTNINIPNSVTTIGMYAFSRNSLTEVTIPSNVTGIGKSAFADNLITTFILPTPTREGYDSFTGWIDNEGSIYNAGDEVSNLEIAYIANIEYTLTDNDVIVIDGIIESCNYDFFAKNIIIPEVLDGQTILGVADKSIGEGVFQSKYLTSVQIPSSVTTIGDYAFYNNSLTSIQLSNNLTEIGERAFSNNLLSVLDIPAGIITIGDYAFSNNSLASISIPNSVTSIGGNAFYANSLNNVSFEPTSNLIEIGRSAFQDNALTNVVIPNSVTLIGDNAFYWNSITNVTFEDDCKVKTIGMSAFYGNSITDLTIPKSVQTIKDKAFERNSLASISFEPSCYLSSIGERAFYDNPLTTLVLPIPAKEGYNSFGGWSGNNGRSTVVDNIITDFKTNYIANFEYTLANDDVVVEDGIIQSCSYDFFAKNIIIPEILDGQTVIGIANKPSGEGVFQSKSLSSVTLPNTLTLIGDYAFYENFIKSLIIPDNLVRVGEHAFDNNFLSGSITIPNTLTEIGNYAFSNWGNHFSNSGFSSVIIEENSSLKIIGDYAFGRNSIDSLIIPDGVTSIGDWAFEGNFMHNITFPQSLISIGSQAFHANYLTNITIPKNVTTIGYGAFSNANLTSLIFEESSSLTTIEGVAFYNNQLTNVTIPNSVELIGASAFRYCPLTSIIIPKNVIEIGEYAFQKNSLSQVSFEDNSHLVRIGRRAFEENNITSLVLPSSIYEGYNFLSWKDENDNVYAEGVAITDFTLLYTAQFEKEISTPLSLSFQTTDISCNGGSNGAIDLTITGGIAPYTIEWTNGANTEDLTNLAAGTYSVTVKDANALSEVAEITLSEPELISVTGTIQQTTCDGGNDGAVTLTVIGGTTSYSYSWSNAAVTKDISALTEGDYIVTITDANGCSISESYTVQSASTLTAHISISAPVAGATEICTGTPVTFNASALSTPNDPVASYTYDFHRVRGGVDVLVQSGVSAVYTDNTVVDGELFYVVVTDMNSGCSNTSSSITITVNPNPAVNLTASVTTACNGDVVDFVATPGYVDYTFYVNGNAVQQSVTNTYATSALTDGDRVSVLVNTIQGCTGSSSEIEMTIFALPVASIEGSAIVCANTQTTYTTETGMSNYVWTVVGGVISNDDNNGTVTVVWSGEGEQSITVRYENANGCTAENSLIVTSQSGVTLITDIYDINCAGQCDGVAIASASGGAAPYTYSWSNGATGTFQFNLCQDTYTVTVTDANGCSEESTFTINEPEMIALSLTPTDVTCGGAADGVITTEVTGGTAPFTYSWDNEVTTKDANNLAGGFYYLTVTDANGCMENEIAQVEEPAPIVVTSLSNEPTCAGNNDGSIDVSISGGSAPYNYSWSNGKNTEDISSLQAGKYNLTVIDAMSCSQTVSVELTEPEALFVSVTAISPGCSGANNGSASATVTGGTAPFSYSWSTGATAASIDELSEGSYTVIVTDAMLCSVSETIEIVSPTPMEVSLTATQPTCESLNNGSLLSVITGGVEPYSYSWSNGESSTEITDLSAGTYELTVTDAAGCFATVSSELTYLSTITGSINLSDITCADMCNGYAIAQGSGGDGTYNYSWNDGTNGAFRNNLCSGEYSVTITDGQGCTVIVSETLTEPQKLLVSGVATDATCKGEANGSILLEVSGGTEAYTYEWNNGSREKDLANISAGYYRVSVTDANACSTLADFTLTEPSSVITVSGSISDVTCANESNGSILLSVNGGSSDYTYLWSNGVTSKDLVNISGGSYDVTITDFNGCTTTESYNVNEPSGIIAASGMVSDVKCAGESNGSIVLSVSGGSGDYSYLWSNGTTSKDLNGVSGGSYEVTITDIKGCTTAESYVVNEPSGAIAASGVVSDVACAGESNGSIVLSVSGGSGDYSYLWSNGATSKDLANVSGGSYDVTISDMNGCSSQESYMVNEPVSGITVSGTSTNAACNGEATGSITIEVSGGAEPYTYDWSNGSVDKNPTDLSVGWYDVVVSDANGCNIVWSTSVGESSKATLAGVASFSKGTIDAEDADVVLLDASEQPYKEVTTVRMQSEGYFEFNNVVSGSYLVYVKLDNHAKQKYPGVMHSYYNTTHKWAEADVISIACSDYSNIDLVMFENPAANKVGNGNVAGQVTYDNGSLKSSQPPVSDAVVMMIDESNGLPVDYVTTDANGYYQIDNIANGNYSIYVDVAGLTLVSTYQLAITESQFDYTSMDFEVDIVVDMDITKVESLPTDVDQLFADRSVKVYPNPTKSFVYLQSELFDDSVVKVGLYSIEGGLLYDYKGNELERNGNRVRIELPELSSGYYLIRTEVNDIVHNKKIIVGKR